MSWSIIENDTVNNDDKKDYDIQYDIDLIFNKNPNKEIVLCVGKVQSGKTNKMFKCIEEAFDNYNYDITIIFAGNTSYLYDQTLSRLKNKNYYDYEIFSSKNKISLNNNKKLILVIMKNNTGLDETFNYLWSLDLTNKKVLILDDESDYASININKNGLSATYKRILELYNRIHCGKMLQVTATPFANIVSPNSKDLLPNRIVCWNNSNEYTGLFEFDENKNHVYEKIECSKDDDKSYKKYIYQTVKYFLCTIVNNYEYLFNKEEVSCLFNVDLDIKIHKNICEIIEWSLKNIWKNYSEIYEDKINKNISFDLYRKILTDIYNDIAIIELNSTQEKIDKKKFNIYVGGTMLSRGNTFENLITEMIINAPSNTKVSVDTLLQRCRWFGYRNDILKMMKIFVSPTIYESLIESKKYLEILKTGEHTWSDLCRKINILDSQSQFVKSTGKA